MHVTGQVEFEIMAYDLAVTHVAIIVKLKGPEKLHTPHKFVDLHRIARKERCCC